MRIALTHRYRRTPHANIVTTRVRGMMRGFGPTTRRRFSHNRIDWYVDANCSISFVSVTTRVHHAVWHRGRQDFFHHRIKIVHDPNISPMPPQHSGRRNLNCRELTSSFVSAANELNPVRNANQRVAPGEAIVSVSNRLAHCRALGNAG